MINLHSAFLPSSVRLVQCALAILLTCSVSHGAEAEVLWRADISSQPHGSTEGFGPDTSIVQEGDLHYLSKKGPLQEVIFQEAGKGAAAWVNYRSTVRFRFSENCQMIIAVKDRGLERLDADYLWYYVAVNKTTLTTSIHHLKEKDSFEGDPRVGSDVELKSSGFPNLEPDTWITFSVDVGEKVLRVRLVLDSGEKGEWEFPVFPGTGGSRIVARAPVDISEFVIEQLPEPVMPKE